jgi:signal transduction histidine kinase
LLHQESQRLRRLVEGLLNFGRIEAGRMQFSFEPVNPAALVREVVDDFAKTDQGARRHIDLFTNDGALVSVDREMLRSVVWNLVENAAKYSPTDAPIAVQVAQTNGQVRIAVRDRGTGIPESERGRIFEKFVRGAAARDVGGTGVGLAVAQRIVHAHGGDIRVDSEPGQGSTFSVLLPAVRESIPVGVTTHNRTSET